MGRMAIITLLTTFHSHPAPLGTGNTYSPKESSLKNSPRGPIGRVSLPCLIWLENSFTPKKHEFFFLFPKESSLKNSPRGPFGRVLSLPCIIGWKFFSPRRSMFFYFLLCGWWCGVVWGVLPFGTLDHVRTIFFKFLVL